MIRLLLIMVLTSSAWTMSAQNHSALWDSANSDFNRERYFAAIEKLHRFASLYPDSKIAWLNLGKAYSRIQDIEHACEAFAKADHLGSTGAGLRNKWICNDGLKRWMAKFYFTDQEVMPDNDFRPLFTKADTLRGSLRPARTSYDVIHYGLQVEIFPKRRQIAGCNQITFRVIAPFDSLQLDLDDKLSIDSIIYKGIALSYTRVEKAVFVTFPQSPAVGRIETMEVFYSGTPRKAPKPPWDGGLVWKRDSRGQRWLGVACEHLGASVWWPCKDHLSDKPDSMNITIILPRGLRGVANGVPVETKPLPNRTMAYHWKVSYPIVNYNATFYAGKFQCIADTFHGANGKLALDYYVLPRNYQRAKDYFRQTHEVLQVFEKYFGPYPFYSDGFALVESPYAGMEHQGAIAYGNGYGRRSSHRFRNSLYDYIIVHEAAHEWWGNSLTNADMADVWIHEGMATYAEILFIDEQLGAPEALFELTEKYKQIFNFWPLVGTAGVNDNSFASGDVYNKGAAMLHSLRCLIDNDSVFFALIHRFAGQYRHQVVQSSDFTGLAKEVTGLPLDAFFQAFLHQAKPPVLKLAFEQTDTTTLLRYQWVSVPDGFTMPFAITTTGGAVRLIGTTSDNTVAVGRIEDVKVFNIFSGPADCPVNSFTYFYTRFETSSTE